MDRIAVSIPSFRRFDFTEQCLSRICCQNVDVFLIPDFDNEEMIEKKNACARKFRCNIIDPPTKRLHCDGNTINGITYLFDHGYDLIFHLDDDIIVNPQYIKLMLSLNEWCSGDQIVSTATTFDWNLAVKHYMAGAVMHSFHNASNFLINREIWDAIKSDVLFCRDNFYTTSPINRDNEAIRTWFKSKIIDSEKHPEYMWEIIYCKSGGTGFDALLQMAIASKGIRATHTFVNRAKNIGIIGENANPISSYFYERTSLEDIPGDETRSEFYYTLKI